MASGARRANRQNFIFILELSIAGLKWLNDHGRRLEPLRFQCVSFLSMIRSLLILALFSTAGAETLHIQKTDRIGRKIENKYFVADLSSRDLDGNKEDGGALRALTYKAAGVTLLRTQHAV